MMPVLKALYHDWLPPALDRWVRRKRARGVCFEGDFATWEDASTCCTGYDADQILTKVLDATLKVKNGEAVFERDSVLFDEIDYAWPVLAGIMWCACRNGGRLNVLDFGGALGSSYFQNRKFLRSTLDLRWNVVEQTHYVEAGQAYIQDDQLRFYKSIEECLSENRPNVILFSSVLQYLKSPHDIVNKLSGVGADCFIIDRTPFSTDEKDRLVIQRVPPTIYSASYPMWVFSYANLLKKLSVDWRLMASNTCPEGTVKSMSGFEFSFQGMMLESQW